MEEPGKIITLASYNLLEYSVKQPKHAALGKSLKQARDFCKSFTKAASDITSSCCCQKYWAAMNISLITVRELSAYVQESFGVLKAERVILSYDLQIP